MINLTDNAVNHLRSLAGDRQATQAMPLRIDVERGGCAGLQYAMSFCSPQPGDHAIERDGVTVFVAPEAAEFMRGSVIDYFDGLTGAGFKIQNPNAVRSCGCGTSFEAN